MSLCVQARGAMGGMSHDTTIGAPLCPPLAPLGTPEVLLDLAVQAVGHTVPREELCILIHGGLVGDLQGAHRGDAMS